MPRDAAADAGDVPQAVAALFPSSSERRRIDDWLTRLLLEAALRVQLDGATSTPALARASSASAVLLGQALKGPAASPKLAQSPSPSLVR